MEHNLEFRNFERNNKYILADMFLDGKFIVRFTDSVEHVLKEDNTKIALYEFFKIAVKEYLSNRGIYNMEQHNISVETIH